MPGPRWGTPKILISISTTNPTYILHIMPEDIQEHMCALIAHHGSAFAALQ
jgi:predicted metallopeptidase